MMIFLKVIVLLIGLCVSPRVNRERRDRCPQTLRVDARERSRSPRERNSDKNSRVSTARYVDDENSVNESPRKDRLVDLLPLLDKDQRKVVCDYLEAVKEISEFLPSFQHVSGYHVDATMREEPKINFDNAFPVSVERLKRYVKQKSEAETLLSIVKIIDRQREETDDKGKPLRTTRALQFGGLDHTSLPIFLAFNELVVVDPYARDDASSAPEIPLIKCLRSTKSVTHIEAHGGPETYFEAFEKRIIKGTKFDLVTITGPYPLAAAMIILPYITLSTIIKVNANIAREELLDLRKHYLIKSNVEDEDFPMRQKRAMVLRLNPVPGKEVSYKKFIGPAFDDSNIDEAERLMKQFKTDFYRAEEAHVNKLNLLWRTCESDMLKHTSEFISLFNSGSEATYKKVKKFCEARYDKTGVRLAHKPMWHIAASMKGFIKSLRVPLYHGNSLLDIIAGFRNTALNMARDEQAAFEQPTGRLEKLRTDMEKCKNASSTFECANCTFTLLYADLIKFVHLRDLDK